MDDVRLWFSELPPSLNKLYYYRSGRRVLTKTGRTFKNSMLASRGGLTAAEAMKIKMDPHGTYAAHFWFYLPRGRVISERYGQDGRVKHPFQRIDTTNLVKLAEDVTATLLGVDDRCNWSVLLHKRIADANHPPGVIVLIEEMDLSEDDDYEPPPLY